MSLEETRDGELAVAAPALAEIPAETAEKPKTTRRRTVKKDDDETKTPAKKATTKTKKTATSPSAESGEETSEEAAPKKVTRRRTTKKTPEEEAAIQLEIDAAILAQPTTGTATKTAAPQTSAPTETPAPATTQPLEHSDPTATTQRSSEQNTAIQSLEHSAPTARTPRSDDWNTSTQRLEHVNPTAGEAVPTPELTSSNASETALQTLGETVPTPSQEPRSGAGEAFGGAPVAPENASSNFYTGENSGFAPREEGFRSGRMSYRERRALRRAERTQNRENRPPRLGPDGAPLPYENGAPRENSAPRENVRFEREGRDNRENQGRFERESREIREGRENQGRFEREGRFERAPRRRDVDLPTLEAMSDDELRALAAEMSVEAVTAEGDLRPKDELVMALLEAQAQAQNATLKKGILDIVNDNKAYLRCDGYHPGDGDVYVSNTQIKRFGLKPGDMVLGAARAPKDNERFHGLLRVEAVNGLPVEAMRYRREFEKLTPIFPDERFVLETGPGNITARIIDLISPVGKGQRGLIVAPPKAGKTTLIKSIANSITQNYPEVKLFVLLIDERPEEVTDISRSVIGEVVASTFDETPDNHMRVAEIVMERAKRLAEMNHDVVILMDSITRLSRASNLVVSPSGRTLSGGLDPAAMYKPKRMFGAARNIEGGGSLTILATALVDTGSRMDEMIFEEFKGTGNMDLVLDRDLFNQRIFPAIDINRSGTRRDDLLMSKDELAATYHLRRTLAQLDNDKAVTLLIDRLKNTKSNAHFMEVVAKSARQQANGG